MRLKYFFTLLIICISSVAIFCLKEYYVFERNVKKQDELTLETIKTLKKLIIFTASNSEENASDKEVQKLLSLQFGYNLIFDNDVILNNTRLSTIKNGKLLSSSEAQYKNNNQLSFAEALSKKYRNKPILYSAPSLEEGSIYILYTTHHSPNTFILSFPLPAISSIKIQMLEKTGFKPVHLPLLQETNKFLSEEFISENAIFHHDLNYLNNINAKYHEIIRIFLVQTCSLIVGWALVLIANLKKNRILAKLYQMLEINTEKDIINKLLEYKNRITKLDSSTKHLENTNIKLKKIAEINKKSVSIERNINKTIAKNLDYELHKITQLTGDAIKNFDAGISMSNQMIENLLNTIKDSTARLLFLKNGQAYIHTNKLANVKDCLEKALTLFGPELQDIGCKIDILHFDEKLVHPGSKTSLIQMFNGILNRLLFSMEQADGNFIKITAEKDRDRFKLIFENSSLGIYPSVTDTTELVSSFLSVPNWISTKAIAKTLNISVEESFILGKGDLLILNFKEVDLRKGECLDENVYSIS